MWIDTVSGLHILGIPQKKLHIFHVWHFKTTHLDGGYSYATASRTKCACPKTVHHHQWVGEPVQFSGAKDSGNSPLLKLDTILYFGEQWPLEIKICCLISHISQSIYTADLQCLPVHFSTLLSVSVFENLRGYQRLPSIFSSLWLGVSSVLELEKSGHNHIIGWWILPVNTCWQPCLRETRCY